MQSLVATQQETSDSVARSQISVTVGQGDITGGQLDTDVDTLWDLNIVDSGSRIYLDFDKWDGKCGTARELELRGARAGCRSMGDRLPRGAGRTAEISGSLQANHRPKKRIEILSEGGAKPSSGAGRGVESHSMRTGIKARLLIAAGALVGMTGGFLVGRQFPAHHYQAFNSVMVIDTSTGEVCSLKSDSQSVPRCPGVRTALEVVRDQTKSCQTGDVFDRAACEQGK